MGLQYLNTEFKYYSQLHRRKEMNYENLQETKIWFWAFYFKICISKVSISMT